MGQHAAITAGGAVRRSAAVSKPANHSCSAEVMRVEVIAGLSHPQKSLPCKYFYDEHGSKLFDAICELPEYYLTRTELQIMRDHIDDIANAIGPGVTVVEYGSGSSVKTRILLDNLKDVADYVPIDISEAPLLAAAAALAMAYPHLEIKPICADYTQPLRLTPILAGAASKKIAYFPGSTIGNFEPEEARAFLRGIRATCGVGCGLLIGADLKKTRGCFTRLTTIPRDSRPSLIAISCVMSTESLAHVSNPKHLTITLFILPQRVGWKCTSSAVGRILLTLGTAYTCILKRAKAFIPKAAISSRWMVSRN